MQYSVGLCCRASLIELSKLKNHLVSNRHWVASKTRDREMTHPALPSRLSHISTKFDGGFKVYVSAWPLNLGLNENG